MTLLSRYNIRQSKPPRTETVTNYFNQSAGQTLFKWDSSVKVGSQADKLFEALREDIMQDYSIRVEYLLLKQVPVLVYVGQNNMVVSSPAVMRWVDELEHSHKAEFDAMSFSKWRVNNKTIGVRKQAGLLELRVAFDAGHFLPIDQPLVAKAMAKEFVGRVTK